VVARRGRDPAFRLGGALTASAIQQSTTNPSEDAGYAWFIANSTELFQMFASDDLLRSLEYLEIQLNLPEGTANRFKALYDEACSVSEHEEVLYATTWDAYHESLDNDHNLATFRCKNANLVFVQLSVTGVIVFCAWR
jgi:hypothetical protein